MSMTDRDVRPTRFELMLEYLPMLADACRADVAHFLLHRTRTVLRCLLELRAIFDAHEVTTSILGYGSTTSVAGYKLVRGRDLVLLEHTVQTAKERRPESDEDVESQRPALL
ncbi:hypothetical protein BJV77DRAFT_1070704 [Russula vinacea]|nr:hypothetical protein BJV77DRAFT_1070704 [Russula vinacea]